jgi:hypothetical protein
MKACLMDWDCECGVSATNVPLIGLSERDVAGVALANHHEHHPCPLITSKHRRVSIQAERRLDLWRVKIGSTPLLPTEGR